MTTFRVKSSAPEPRPQYRYKIYAIADGPPPSPAPDDGLHQLRYWAFDRAPTRVRASATAKMIEIGDTQVFLAPAPSEIVFEVPENASVIKGALGVQFSPLPSGGEVDQADFTVEFVDGKQNVKLLLRQRLTPNLDPRHRRKQPFRLALPQDARGLVRLRATIPGPSDDQNNRTYWLDIRFHP